MAKKVSDFYMNYNLGSKNIIRAPLNRRDIVDWFTNEIKELDSHLREIVLKIFLNSEFLYNFSEKAFLLWIGCDRKKSRKSKQKYHTYPDIIEQQAKQKNIYLDRRSNGPAIAAFEFAGGIRPVRYGSNNKWHIHHLYSGKFPYLDKKNTLHTVKNGLHFTQAAGLIALHPLIDALVDDSPAFTWFLRYESYKKFGYDPDHVFSEKIDKYGFDRRNKTKLGILYK